MVALKMSSLRLRLVFKNCDILSDAQKAQGYHKSWILIPQNQTQLTNIDALCSYITQLFNLKQSCPHGLLLCMDGFVLPPFESTGLLKDKDIISVTKKGALAILGNETGDGVELLEDVQRQPGNSGALLLTNQELDSENGDCQSKESHDELLEDEEDKRHEVNLYLEDGNEISKKRKASEKLQGSKKKKKRSEQPESAANDGHENGDLAGEKHTSKKRKSSKRTRINAATIENGDERMDKDVESTPKSKCAATDVNENGDLAGEKGTSKKRKSSKKTQTNAAIIDNGDEKMDKDVESTPKSKRSEQAQENSKDIDDNTNVSESTPKNPSRSARRKKVKRKWLQEMAKIKKKNMDSPEVKNWKEMQSSSGKKEGISLSEKEGDGQLEKEGLDNPKAHWKQFGDNSKSWSKPEENQSYSKHGNSNKNSSTANEVIPIEIRPGHIRFEPLEEDADHVVQQIQAPVVSVDTFQWNGITSKKKGQKWGTDKSYGSHGNGYEQFNQGGKAQKWGRDKTFDHYGNGYEQPKQGERTGWGDKDPDSRLNGNEQSNYENETSVVTHTQSSEQMDFYKLPPLPNLPKEGDVIAYRLLELSSSWTPEMSSYRVGKISRYDSQSRKVTLMPLPEYPIIFKKSEEEEESTEQQDGNLYNEDGSLEIEFTSLIDVRIVKSGDPSASNGILDQGNGGSICANNMETPKVPGNKDKSTNIVVQGNGGIDQGKSSQAPSTGNGANLWEQFNDVLNAKKEELSKDSSWGKSNGNKSSSWSHRVLKGSTLGPTMVFLRSENEKNKM